MVSDVLRALVLGGLSGSGKDTALKLLLDTGRVRKGTTITTRPARPGEIDGYHYDFLTPEDFRFYRDAGALAEETIYIGNPIAYGISWKRIYEAQIADIPTAWILDSIGLQRMRELFNRDKETLGIFLWAKPETLAFRMRSRGEDEATITRRLSRYQQELELGLKHFDHVVDTAHQTPQRVAGRILKLMGD